MRVWFTKLYVLRPGFITGTLGAVGQGATAWHAQSNGLCWKKRANKAVLQPLKIGSKDMSHNNVLRWEFDPASEPADCHAGWGQGILYLFGQPFWYAGSQQTPQPIAWTWVDVLEYLAAHWGALLLEQSLPFGWLHAAADPASLWPVAERRWAGKDDATADQEEAVLLAFERRHNLAYACKGMALPALTILRNGQVCWLCAQDQTPVRVPLADIYTGLQEMGTALANAFAHSTHPRVQAALQAWQQRAQQASADFLRWTTGQEVSFLRKVQGGASSASFWNVPAANDATLGMEALFQEGPLLAAARMAREISDPENQVSITRQLLQAVRQVLNRPASGSNQQALDRLMVQCARFLQQRAAPQGQPEFAFFTGYAVAEWVRNHWRLDRPVYLDIERLVQKTLGVSVLEQPLGTPLIDALAVWSGTPACIVLNSQREHPNTERTRMTLAHELAHLLLDRNSGLPFCEVLGGAVDGFTERRANAFAAELLLPRSVVAARYASFRGSVREFVYALKQDFGVSKSVVCAQIYNSTAFDRLDLQAQGFVEQRLKQQRESSFGITDAAPVQRFADAI